MGYGSSLCPSLWSRQLALLYCRHGCGPGPIPLLLVGEEISGPQIKEPLKDAFGDPTGPEPLFSVTRRSLPCSRCMDEPVCSAAGNHIQLFVVSGSELTP